MNNFNIKELLRTSIVCCAFSLSLASCTSAQQQPANIALGKTVTFNKAPNYALCTDPDDKIQLTDGKYSSEGDLQETQNTRSLWVQKGTVGWQNTSPVIITIDLGSVQPISGVSYSTAAGGGGVSWPAAIYITTSDDGKIWHYAGNLIPLSQKNGRPPTDDYANFRYVTHDLHTKGRYISFGVVDTPFIFADEIEVYQGDNSWLAQPTPGRVISSMEDLIHENSITSYAQRRLDTDIADIRDEVNQSNLPAGVKSTFTARLDQDAIAAEHMEPLPADFRTILPLNDTHRDILAVHGELLAAEGQKPLTVWHQHRYAWLPLLATPGLQNRPQLDFSMLRNQFRSDDLLLTNAGGKPQKVTLQLENAPQNVQDGWLKVYSVAWTDTAQGTPVADALIPIDADRDTYQVDVPAGMTRKIWFTVDSSKVPSGIYKGTLEVTGAGQKTAVPFHLDISKAAMNTPRFSMGVWDYTNGDGNRAVNPQNRQAAIALMRSHYVDSTWASPGVLPQPAVQDFDAQGNLTAKLDFSQFDQWVAMWPGTRHYFVFANVPDHFAGTKINTPEFNVRAGAWAKVLSAHLKELHLQPKQVGILLVDEPSTDTEGEIIAAWAKAIKAAAPEITLFEDPRWVRPDKAKIQDAITLADVLCPDFPVFKTGGEAVKQYYANLRAQGKEMWFYQCSGPVREYDPQGYYRYQPWQAFANGATGQGFWAFGDTGSATSWNEYSSASGRINYAPAFLGKDTVYDSVHWDAVREGVEDYEELAMVQDAINKSNDITWRNNTQQALDNAVASITQLWKSPNYSWQNAPNPELADMELQKVQALLEN